MRNLIVRAAAALLAVAWIASASAQDPAVSPKEADLAKLQQQQQKVQPLNNQPVWSEVRSGLPQFTSLPGRETSVLIQPQGQTWRALRVPITTMGGFLIALALLGLIGYYTWRGKIEVQGKLTGRVIERFSAAERVLHWSMALSFVALGITGLVVTFGRSVLLPLIGYTLFSWLATLSKAIHNIVGPIFAVALLLFIGRYLRNNIMRGYDFQWIGKFGGMLDRSGGTHVPSGKFNAGEKVLFWLLVVVLSITLVVSGFVLLFPNFDQTRSAMQIANIVHLVAALLAVAMACFHIYLGTLGMAGAYEAMRHGYVDETWAKEHHEYWYNDVISGNEPRGPVESVPLGKTRTA